MGWLGPGAVLPLNRTVSIAAFLALLILATARIVATYSVFNDTVDEAWHIGCGMVWLSGRPYDCNPEHPPLARGMLALGPYLAGARDTGDTRGDSHEGRAVLNYGGNFDRMLALARMGVLPFFWLACFVVYAWTRRAFGEPAAFFATLCFTMFPAILAHAGLATTDMPAVGSIGAAFLAMLIWLERPGPALPGWKGAIVFGAALALAALSKFSSLALLPAAALATLLCYLVSRGPVTEPVRRCLPSVALVVLTTAMLVWAGYRFHFSHVPAPELWQGIRDVLAHNRGGHPGYLLGHYGEHGWWYYYPVAIAVKTPLALLALIAVGIFACWKQRVPAPLAYAAGILLFAATVSNINLGIRHILPAYVGLCVVAGAGAAWLSSTGTVARVVAYALLAWLTFASVRSHPDYLAYFNEIAGEHPENFLVDSDLDWGQDMKRLARRMQQLDVKELAFDPFNGAYIEELQNKGQFPPIKPLDPLGPAPGWNAASITMLKLWRLGTFKSNPPVELWTDRIPPTERVGKGVLLWYVP
jgi:hypothetical protein